MTMQPIDPIIEAVKELEEKYFQLVWAARKPPLDADAEVWEEYWSNKDQPSYVKADPIPIEIRAEVIKKLRKAVEKYPEEYYDLKNPERDNYPHGFNSGCLAAFRWILSAQEDGVRSANDEFPFLDT
mgnify:CR=1 FL=1